MVFFTSGLAGCVNTPSLRGAKTFGFSSQSDPTTGCAIARWACSCRRVSVFFAMECGMSVLEHRRVHGTVATTACADVSALDHAVAHAMAHACRTINAGDMDGGMFVNYVYKASQTYVDELAALLPAGTGLRLLDPAPCIGEGNHHVRRGRLDALATVVAEEETMVGALIDLRISGSDLENCTGAAPLDLRKDPRAGVAASDWLFDAPAARLSAVLERYAALHDPLLAARLMELVVSRQHGRGTAYSCVGELADVLAELQADFELEHANQVGAL